MELSDIRIFIAIAEEGSSVRAAKRLAMTQPGVSQHLKRLETELKRPLFDRVAKRLVLNDFGRQFLGRAREFLEQAARLAGIARGASCPLGTLKLGLTDSSTMTVIPPAISKFRKLYPGVKIQLDVDDSGDIEDRVIREQYDMGVVTKGDRPNPLLEEEVLYYERIDALVFKKHPLAKRRVITMEELASQPLLVYPRRSRTRQIIDEAFYGAGIVPKEMIDVYISTAAARLAEVEMGIALLSEAFIKEEIGKHRCVHLKISGSPFRRAISIVRKKGAHMSDAAASFYRMLIRS